MVKINNDRLGFIQVFIHVIFFTTQDDGFPPSSVVMDASIFTTNEKLVIK